MNLQSPGEHRHKNSASRSQRASPQSQAQTRRPVVFNYSSDHTRWSTSAPFSASLTPSSASPRPSSSRSVRFPSSPSPYSQTMLRMQNPSAAPLAAAQPPPPQSSTSDRQFDTRNKGLTHRRASPQSVEQVRPLQQSNRVVTVRLSPRKQTPVSAITGKSRSHLVGSTPASTTPATAMAVRTSQHMQNNIARFLEAAPLLQDRLRTSSNKSNNIAGTVVTPPSREIATAAVHNSVASFRLSESVRLLSASPKSSLNENDNKNNNNNKNNSQHHSSREMLSRLKSAEHTGLKIKQRIESKPGSSPTAADDDVDGNEEDASLQPRKLHEELSMFSPTNSNSVCADAALINVADPASPSPAMVAAEAAAEAAEWSRQSDMLLLEERRQRIEQLTTELGRCQKQLLEHSRLIAVEQQRVQEQSALVEQQQRLIAEKEKLLMQLQDENQQHQTHTKEYNQMTSDLAAAAERESASRKETQGLHDALVESEHRLEQLRSQVTAGEVEIRELKLQRDLLLSERDTLQSRAGELADKLRDERSKEEPRRVQVEAALEANEQLRAQLHGERRKVERLEHEKEELETEMQLMEHNAMKVAQAQMAAAAAADAASAAQEAEVEVEAGSVKEELDGDDLDNEARDDDDDEEEEEEDRDGNEDDDDDSIDRDGAEEDRRGEHIQSQIDLAVEATRAELGATIEQLEEALECECERAEDAERRLLEVQDQLKKERRRTTEHDEREANHLTTIRDVERRLEAEQAARQRVCDELSEARATLESEKRLRVLVEQRHQSQARDQQDLHAALLASQAQLKDAQVQLGDHRERIVQLSGALDSASDAALARSAKSVMETATANVGPCDDFAFLSAGGSVAKAATAMAADGWKRGGADERDWQQSRRSWKSRFARGCMMSTVSATMVIGGMIGLQSIVFAGMEARALPT